MAISEDLTLNLGPALAEAREFEQTLLGIIQNISAALSSEVNAALAQTDASPVKEEIEEAVTGADKTTELEPDAEALAPAIEGGIAEADKVAVLDADAEGLPAPIEAALDAADKTIVVEGDVSELGPAVEAELDAADTSIVVEAESAGLQDLSTRSQEAAGGLGDLAAQSLALKGGTDLLSGATGALSGSFGGLAAKAGPYGAAIAAVASATTLFVGGAIEAQAVTERFGRSFGPLAAQVEQIDIGGLNISLADLAEKLGADDDALRTTASNLATLGQSSGATAQQTAVMSEQVIALASYLSATNPSLGTADQIADRLSSTLARGGRATAGLGLALNAAEIEARALQMTGKATAEELTIYDKAAAGAALATEQLGDQMGKGIAEGAKTGVIQLRAFKTGISEAIEGLGAPLIGPVLSIVKSVGPILGQVATTVGTALQAILPSISRAIALLSPFVTIVLGGINVVLSAITKAVQLIDSLLGPVYDKIAQVTGFIGGALSKVAEWFGTLGDGAPKTDAAAQATDRLGGATEAAGEKIARAGDKVTTFSEEDLKKLQDASDAAVQKVADGLPGISAAFGKVVEDSKVSVAELRQALLEQLITESQFFANLNTIVQKGGRDIANTILAMGPEQGAALAKAVATATPFMVAQLEFQAGQVKTLNREFAVQWGMGVGPGFLEGLAAISDSMTHGTIQATKKVVAAGKSAAGPGGRELGVQLGTGINQGIQDTLASISATLGKIKTLGAGVFKATSPSRWAIGLGSDIGTGLALGIEQTLPRVGAALGSVTSFVTPAAVSSSSSSVTVAPGAVQITFAGGVSPSAVPAVEAAVDQAFGRLLQELGRR